MSRSKKGGRNEFHDAIAELRRPGARPPRGLVPALVYVGDTLPILAKMCRSAGLEPDPDLILGLYELVEDKRQELLEDGDEGLVEVGDEGELAWEDEEAPLRQEIAFHARRLAKADGAGRDLGARVFAEIQLRRPEFAADVAAVYEGDPADYVEFVVAELYADER